MILPPAHRFESADTIRIDRDELQRACRSDQAFDDWAASQVQSSLLSSRPPPAPEDE